MDKYIKIKTLFEKNADEDRAESMAHYMRDQFCFYGLSSPKRKTLYKDFLKEENRFIKFRKRLRICSKRTT